MARPSLRPFALLALSAFLLAGCADEAPADDAVVPAPVEPAPAPELRNFTFTGTATRVANFCFSEGGAFEDDVGGWGYLFETDVPSSYVVWQDGGEQNMGTAEPGEGEVPDGAASFFVCTDILDPPVLTEAHYTLTVTEPAPAPDANATAAPDAA